MALIFDGKPFFFFFVCVCAWSQSESDSFYVHEKTIERNAFAKLLF